MDKDPATRFPGVTASRGPLALGACLVVLSAALAGCVLPPPGASQRTYLGDVELDDARRIALETESGLLALRVSNPQNVSLLLQYSFEWEASELNPLQIAYLDDAGGVFVPLTLRAEYETGRLESPAYARAGPLQHTLPGARAATEVREGVEFHFTDATTAYLVVTWANLQGRRDLWIHWLPGTQVEEVASTSAVQAYRLADFQGGAGAGLPFVTADRGSAVRAGEAGADLYAVVKVARAGAQRGVLTVRDETGVRVISLDTLGEQSSVRCVMTAFGETTFQVDGVSAGGLRVTLLAAAIPKGALPPQLWHEQNEVF